MEYFASYIFNEVCVWYYKKNSIAFQELKLNEILVDGVSTSMLYQNMIYWMVQLEEQKV